MEKAKRITTEAARAAKDMRKLLKEAGFKAQVKSKNYSGGDSITANFENLTPSEYKKASAICKAFQGGYFCGYEDIYNHDNTNEKENTVKFVFTNNQHNENRIAHCWEYLTEHYSDLSEAKGTNHKDAYKFHGWKNGDQILSDSLNGNDPCYWEKFENMDEEKESTQEKEWRESRETRAAESVEAESVEAESVQPESVQPESVQPQAVPAIKPESKTKILTTVKHISGGDIGRPQAPSKNKQNREYALIIIEAITGKKAFDVKNFLTEYTAALASNSAACEALTAQNGLILSCYNACGHSSAVKLAGDLLTAFKIEVSHKK